MAVGTQGDGSYGRSADPAVDAAEHLAAAIGTEAWPQARDRMVGLLADDGASASARVQAWAAEAQRREGADLNRFLSESLPQWQQEITAALAHDPERAAQARRFADTVQSLLPPPDTGAAQIATATGHGTVNAVQNGNIYYQVVLGLASRPKKLGRGATVGSIGAAGTASVAGGVAAAEHFASEAVKQAGKGHLPSAPLADPAQAPTAAATAPAGGTSTAGTAGAAKGGSAFLAKAGAALAKVPVIGAAAGGVSVPVVTTVVSVVVVVVTTVTVIVTRTTNHASCDAAVHGRAAPAVLAEAARRVELTSFRFDVTRGRHHVTGAADPQSRVAWFTQGLAGGPVVTGSIDRGKVVLPAGTTTPAGADPRWVRADGAFTDAADPVAPARQLNSATAVRRKGCTFTGTLTPMPAPAAQKPRPEAELIADGSTSSSPSGSASAVPFTAGIDDRGRLVRLTTEASDDGTPLAARYSDFGLTVTPSAPPSPTASGAAPSATGTLAGKWEGTWTTEGPSGGFTAALAQDGNRITGNLTVAGTACSLDGPLSGTLDGDRITFGTVNSAGKITFTGSVDGASMHGAFTTDCYGASGSWDARRSSTNH